MRRVRVRRAQSNHDWHPAERVRPPGHGRRSRFCRVDRIFLLAIVMVIGTLDMVLSGSAYAANSDVTARSRRPAVATPNARLVANYDYAYTDSTETTAQIGGSTSTLRLGEIETRLGQAKIIGTFPLTHSTGVRGTLRGGFSQQSEDADSGNQDADTGAYGAAVEFLLRDPDLGSFTLGGSYDRLDGDDNYDANVFGGIVDLRIFFPDFGSGEVDWFLRFDYEHREVEGSGRPLDARIDSYRVSGGAGWYLTNNLQLLLGGSWTRAEDSPISREDTEGFVTGRWRLPTLSSLELTFGGRVGVSEYKLSPYPSDDRFIYGGHIGMTYRFESAARLVDSIRTLD